MRKRPYDQLKAEESDELLQLNDSVISVKEARRIIGSDAKNISDEELRALIYSLTSIARAFIKAIPKYSE